MAYRVTPHSVTKIPPADIMFQRKIPYGIPDISTSINNEIINNRLEYNDYYAKQQSKQYQDARRHLKETILSTGDRVLVKQKKSKKLTPPYNPQPYTVTNVKTHMYNRRKPRK